MLWFVEVEHTWMATRSSNEGFSISKKEVRQMQDHQAAPQSYGDLRQPQAQAASRLIDEQRGRNGYYIWSKHTRQQAD